jgi:hypothetical protein
MTLDEPLEARLYGLLRAGEWRRMIVSASYKNALFDFHDKVLDISDYYPQTNEPVIPTGVCPTRASIAKRVGAFCLGVPGGVSRKAAKTQR